MSYHLLSLQDLSSVSPADPTRGLRRDNCGSVACLIFFRDLSTTSVGFPDGSNFDFNSVMSDQEAIQLAISEVAVMLLDERHHLLVELLRNGIDNNSEVYLNGDLEESVVVDDCTWSLVSGEHIC